MNEDIQRRIRHEVYDECRSRFNSEYGVIGPVHLSSFRKFLKPEELRTDSKAFMAHTNWFEKGTTPEAIRLHYGDPKNLPLKDYILYGQMFQACMYGRSIEAMRFRKLDPGDDCQGALIWMYADCWGETGWTIIDYYLSRKPSYYWLKRACQPVRAVVRRRGQRLVTRAVNDTLETIKATLKRGWLRVDGTKREIEAQSILLPANGMLEAGRAKILAKTKRDPKAWFYAAWLEGQGIVNDPSTWFLTPFRELALAKPDLHVRVKRKEITVTAEAYCHGVHVDDGGKEVLTDNYFDLIPGVPRRVQRIDGRPAGKLKFRMVRPG